MNNSITDNYLVITAFSFMLSLVTLSFLERISLKLKIFLSKEKKIPSIGGIGLAIAFIFSYIYLNVSLKISLPFELIYLLILSFIVLIIGIIDDIVNFSIKLKVFFQIVVVFLFIFYGKKIQIHFLPFWADWILSFLWVMGITNAFNLLDIGDGLCSGVSLITISTFLIVSIVNNNILLIGLFAVLLGGCLAFYILNIPPAKIYMGNAGSHFLGFLFAVLSIYGDYATIRNPGSVIIPLLILALPIIDTIYLIIARLKKNLIPLNKSNDHIFLQLLLKGFTVWKALGIIYFITILWCMSAVLIVYGFNYIFLFCVIISFLASIFIVLKLLKPQYLSKVFVK